MVDRVAFLGVGRDMVDNQVTTHFCVGVWVCRQGSAVTFKKIENLGTATHPCTIKPSEDSNVRCGRLVGGLQTLVNR